MVAKTCSIHVQRPIDSGVVGPNATSGDYHCQPESSEDGVSQCEPSRGLFRSLSHGGSGRVKLCRLGHTPNSVEKGRQKLVTHVRKWGEQGSARFGAGESSLFGRHQYLLSKIVCLIHDSFCVSSYQLPYLSVYTSIRPCRAARTSALWSSSFCWA